MPDGCVVRAETSQKGREEREELSREVRVQGRSENFEKLKTADNQLSRRNIFFTQICNT